MVAKGFTQVQDVDYHETTSPTPASAPVKMIAAIVNEKGLPVFHVDVSQTLVQAPLEEEIYMRLPTGCSELSGKVVKILKCQYGLKQAGREWHLLLVAWLVEKIVMEQCKAEPCVFRKVIKNEVSLMVGVHVDDIIVSGEQVLCDEFFSQLKQRFPAKNLGEFKMYTGCAFERDWEKGILEMNQTAFPKNMVQQYNISATSNIPGSPCLDVGPRKYGDPGGNEELPKYGALAGSLMWLSVMTRPDIAKALRACARHSHNPSPRHFFFSFFFKLTYSQWTSSLPSCLWSQRIFPSLHGSRLTFFYRDASSLEGAFAGSRVCERDERDGFKVCSGFWSEAVCVRRC